MWFSIGLSSACLVIFGRLWFLVCLSGYSLFLLGLNSKEKLSSADSNLCLDCSFSSDEHLSNFPG